MSDTCGVCGHITQRALTLGDLYLSNFIDINDSSTTYEKSNLTIMACTHCGTAQLNNVINPDILYSKYWYYSGVNKTMHDGLKNVVDSMISCVPYKENDIWLDIACNDGTLLSKVPDSFRKIGIDPSDEGIQKLARLQGVIVNDYFSKSAYNQVTKDRAKFISCIAMFYDLANPHQFLDDVYDVLDDDGLFVIQMSYTPLMFKQLEFGNICAEHVMYYSLKGLSLLLQLHKFYVVDCELNDINGGSFRVYCTKTGTQHFRNQQQRDIAEIRIKSLLAYEKDNNVLDKFIEFDKNITELKNQTISFIKKAKSEGKTIYGYGASTKGNTLLQYFGLDHAMITKIAERNPSKHGLKTIGTEIPICSEEEMRADHPDYLLLLPWHFIEEFKIREQEYLNNGGKFIVPCPKFGIVE